MNYFKDGGDRSQATAEIQQKPAKYNDKYVKPLYLSDHGKFISEHEAKPSIQRTAGLTPQQIDRNFEINSRWAFSALHDIEIELHTRRFACCPHKQNVFAADDCVHMVKEAESTAHTLFATLPIDLTPKHYSWPVYGLPVDLCLGGVTGSMRILYLTTLFEYGAREVETHIFEDGQWYSSRYKPSQSLKVAA